MGFTLMYFYALVMFCCAGAIFLAGAIIQRSFILLGFLLLTLALVLQYGQPFHFHH